MHEGRAWGRSGGHTPVTCAWRPPGCWVLTGLGGAPPATTLQRRRPLPHRVQGIPGPSLGVCLGRCGDACSGLGPRVDFDICYSSLTSPIVSYNHTENSHLIDFLLSFCPGNELLVVGHVNLPTLAWKQPEFLSMTSPPLHQSCLGQYTQVSLKALLHKSKTLNLIHMLVTTECTTILQGTCALGFKDFK